MAFRRDVIRLYRHIFRLSKDWKSATLSETDTWTEKKYIREEARRLFKRNMKLTDPEEVKVCLDEARSRIDIALHYKNPYPRPIHFAPNFVSDSKTKKAQLRRTKQSKPIYIHSQDT